MRPPKPAQKGQVLDPSWTLPRSYGAFEDPFHITASVKNGSDLQWFRPRPIDDQVRVDRKESHIFVGQVLPTVAGIRGSSKKSYFFADGGFNAVGNCEAGLFFDVTPDLEGDRAQPAAQEQSARSFRFGFLDSPGEHPIDLPGFLRRGRVARCRA